MKIYLAVRFCSDWDGSSTHMIRAYKSRSEGKKYVAKGNKVYKRLQRFYGAKWKEFDKITDEDKDYRGHLVHIACKHNRFEGWAFDLIELDLI